MANPCPKREAIECVRVQAQQQGHHSFEIKVFSPKETLDPEGWWCVRALGTDNSIMAEEKFRPVIGERN